MISVKSSADILFFIHDKARLKLTGEKAIPEIKIDTIKE